MLKTLVRDPVFRLGVGLCIVLIAILAYVHTAGATEGSVTLGVQTCKAGSQTVNAVLNVQSQWAGHNLGKLRIDGPEVKGVTVNAQSYTTTFALTPGQTLQLQVSGTFQTGEAIIFPNNGKVSTKAGDCPGIPTTPPPTTPANTDCAHAIPVRNDCGTAPATVLPTTTVPVATIAPCPADKPVRVEDGSCVPTDFGGPTIPTTSTTAPPKARVIPSPTNPSPTSIAPIGTLPTTGTGTTLAWIGGALVIVGACGVGAVWIDRKKSSQKA